MRNGKCTVLLVALLVSLITVSIPVMGTVDPVSVDFTLGPGESVVELKTVNITELPFMADVLFSCDLSSSMQNFHTNLKNAGACEAIMTGLGTTGVNVNYGVSSHTDYPNSYDSCGYSDTYGTREYPEWGLDFAYSLDQPITENGSDVITAINGMEFGFGWDNPEAYSRIFYESYADPATGWRAGAKRVMVHLGDDSVPHDCNLNEGISGKTDTWSTGCDPGPDEIAGTPDDLDLQTVLASMNANNIILIECQTDETYDEYWTAWTGITGGRLLVTGETTYADDVIGAVTEELTSSSVTNVHILAEPGYENWVSSSWSYTGTTNHMETVPITFTVPAGTPVGNYTFNITIVDDEGISYGVQKVTIHVAVHSPTAINAVPDIGVYSNGMWFLDTSRDGVWDEADMNYGFGSPGCQAVVGDWNHDETDEIGVFLNGGWWLDANGSGAWDADDTSLIFGSPGCQAVTGDWNGDGIDEIGVFLNGGWWLDANGSGAWDADDTSLIFGSPGCQAVIGDWNGDETDEIGVFLNGGWWLDDNGNGVWDADDTSLIFGSPGCQAIVANV